jgi:hypothetical protein
MRPRARTSRIRYVDTHATACTSTWLPREETCVRCIWRSGAITVLQAALACRKQRCVPTQVNATMSVELNAACSESLAQQARGRQDRFYAAATALAPYAVLQQGAGTGGLERHSSDYMRRERRQEVMEKVGRLATDLAALLQVPFCPASMCTKSSCGSN